MASHVKLVQEAARQIGLSREKEMKRAVLTALLVNMTAFAWQALSIQSFRLAPRDPHGNTPFNIPGYARAYIPGEKLAGAPRNLPGRVLGQVPETRIAILRGVRASLRSFLVIVHGTELQAATQPHFR